LAAAAQQLGTVGLVAMADLSACRTERAPGAFREEAAGFDASVTEAFRSGDPAHLLDLDPAQAADLLVAGRAPLQALAGAFADGPAAGRVLYDDAPYGVGYLVAVLTAS
jgi:aromatic ring-opening dioxygenase LigB subunit